MILQDDIVEQEVLRPRSGERYILSYVQTKLSPPGMEDQKTWSEVDGQLRGRVDGTMTLKTAFAAEDLALLPRLKVYVQPAVMQLRLRTK